MRKIVEVVSQSLDWVQPTALEMRYELRAGDDPVATLVFRNMFGLVRDRTQRRRLLDVQARRILQDLGVDPRVRS